MASQNPSKRFSVVIPHFYDEVGWTPKISYDGTQEYTLPALLQALSVEPDSALIVMAYRNFLDGTNGTIALAHAEIVEASTHGSTKIIVAQETGNVQPSYVTFYGQSRADLYAALSGIENVFSGYRAFGGIAIDYIDPFLALKP